MKEKLFVKSFWVFCFALACNFYFSAGQSTLTPDFLFHLTPWDSLRDVGIRNKIDEYTVQPTLAQKKKILSSILDSDTNFNVYHSNYLLLALHFMDGFEPATIEKYNKLVKQNLDSIEWHYSVFDEYSNEYLHLEKEWDELPFPVNSYRCLDFDKDDEIDIILLNQVYFGPSRGIVFFGKQGEIYRYLFDWSGCIFSIENKNGEIAFRYSAYTIDPSETEVYATIVYDFKTKSSCLESKLYFASQTVLPDSMDQPALFEIADSVYLRFSPDKNDTLSGRDSWGDIILTYTIFGNVVAQFPKSASGYVLDIQGEWAFVAFSSKVLFMKSSLHHGMEPGKTDKNWVRTPEIHPAQYWCGWIEKKYLLLK